MAFKKPVISALKSVISAEEAANLQEASDNFRRERDELRAKLDDMTAQAKQAFDDGATSARKSIQREIDASKAGGWRSRPKTIADVLIVFALLIWLVLWLASSARASEPCAPFADLPPDVTMICHAPSGMWVYDSAVWSRYLPTGVRCLKQS